MSTPKWQPGKLYAPGSLVVPRTAPPVSLEPISNADFETGTAAGWTLDPAMNISDNKKFSGTYSVRCTGTGGEMELVHAPSLVYPGKKITAACQYKQGNANAGQNPGRVFLRWYDEAMAPIGDDSLGTEIYSGSNGAWHESRVEAQAPAGAAFVAIGGWCRRNDEEYSYFDHFTWNYNSSGIDQGLVYRAVQDETGYSDTDEPAWPTVNGVQVVDNEVTWEAVYASRVVWEAQPILKSGSVEPEWPGEVGGNVADNTISWRAVSRRVEDPNCPESDIVVITASKVYAGDDDIVRFSATVNPLDWSTPDDAGYLPTGLQQYGANPVAAMGLYRGNLVPFNAEAFQMWQVDEDPANSALLDALPIGSTRHFALTAVSNDLFFLSSQGVRTVGIAGGSTNLQAGDVGMPIDPLVQEAMGAADALDLVPLGLYYPAAGQYWLIFANNGAPGTGDTPPSPPFSEVFVYTMTRVGAVGAWSRYVFPYRIDDWAIKGDDLYLRSEDKIFRVSEDLLGDQLEFDAEPVPFKGEIQWPWLDFGQPGVTKMMVGFDCVCDGAPAIQFGYDQTNPGAFTAAYQIPADTVPGMIIPMPLSAPSFSVRLTFDGTQKWHFRALNVYLSDNRMTA